MVVLGLFASGLSAHAEPAAGRIATMPFSECVSIIAEVAQEMDVAPVSLVDTSDIRSVRFDASDGVVTVTCHRQDSRMLLTRSPTSTPAAPIVSLRQ
jgi:DNA/RNA endonuclease YhcR with UshA esterase domain